MFVSSPISQICLALSSQFKNDEDQEECFNLISELSTNNSTTNINSFDDKLVSFLKQLLKDKNLVFYTSAFVSFYFQKRNNQKMFDIIGKLMNENIEHQKKISEYNAGYLCGVFSTALMSDVGLDNKDNLPTDIKEAIKYIESANIIVHIEKIIQ